MLVDSTTGVLRAAKVHPELAAHAEAGSARCGCLQDHQDELDRRPPVGCIRDGIGFTLLRSCSSLFLPLAALVQLRSGRTCRGSGPPAPCRPAPCHR